MADQPIETGRGLLAPLKREAGDFASGEKVPLLSSNIRQVIGVKAATPDGRFLGEYPWRGDFGAQVARFRHTSLDAGTRDDLARIYVVDALAAWEPRARVSLERTVVQQVDVGGRITKISVRFIPDTAATDNLIGREETAEVNIG
jgi:phage baseplate assembly protein W